MEENKILFTTEATITFDEYVRCSNRICRFANVLSYILWIGIAGFLCILAIRSGRYRTAFLIAGSCAIKVASSPAVKKAKLKEAFTEEESAGNCYLVYDFYEDGYVMTCNMIANDLVRYCDLWSIVETKTNFYLLYEPRNGCILIKEKCSPELIRFLHNIKEDPHGPLYKEGVKATLKYAEEPVPELAGRYGFPYEIINWNTPPDEVVNRYKEALRLAPVNGYPVIFENDERVLAVLEALDEEIDRESLLQERMPDGTPLPDGKKLLREWYRYENDGEELGEHDFDRELIRGNGSPEDTFIATEVCFRVLKNDDLIMLKIPVDAPWKVLAYMPVYNEDYNGQYCPDISEIMAVGKYWYEKYRAVPAVVGCNILEFLAEDIRITESDAWELAEEQMTFCDRALEIDTESESLGELADDLMKTRTWYFMWDQGEE